MKYLTHKAGNLTFLEVDNENGLKIVLSPVGAGIKSIEFCGELMNVTHRLTQDYLEPSSKYGKTLGPIFDEKDKYIIKGKEYALNEESRKYNCSNFIYLTKPYFDKNVFLVTYSFKKKKLTDGLPGNVTYYITYSMSGKSNELLIDYKVMTDEDTVASVSNNILFNLASEDINEIQVSEDKIITLENNKYRLNIAMDGYSSYEIKRGYIEDKLEMSSDIHTSKEGIAIIPLDNTQETALITSKEIYHRQIIYSFEKK